MASLLEGVVSGRLDDARDGSHDALELGDLDVKLAVSVGSEGVVAGTTVAGGDSPLCRDPALEEHALESGIEGAFLYLEDLIGLLLDGLRDLIAVKPAMNGEGFKDKKIERAWRDLVTIFRRGGSPVDEGGHKADSSHATTDIV
jgi:hypothetical protein